MFLAALTGFFLLSFQSFTRSSGDKVLKIIVRGPIDAAIRNYVRNHLTSATAPDVSHVVIDLQSSSGRTDYTLDIVETLQQREIPVSVYGTGPVNGPATILCFAADNLFLRPNVQLSFPPTGTGGTGSPFFTDRSRKILTDRIVQVARRNHHPAGVIHGMLNPSTAVHRIRINGRTEHVTDSTLDQLRQEVQIQNVETVSSPGQLLTPGATELERSGISVTVSSLSELLGVLYRQEKVHALNVPVRTIRMQFSDHLLRWLSNYYIVALLGIVGTTATLLEISRPGSGWTGFIALLSFSVPLISFTLLGLTGILEPVLLVLGLSMLALDTFLIPGLSSAGFGGLLALICSIILAPHASLLSTLTQPPWKLHYLFESLSTGLLSMGLGTVVYGTLPTLFPGFFYTVDLLTVTPANPNDNTPDNFKGQPGKVVDEVRPIGVIRVDDQDLSVISRSFYLDTGLEFTVEDVNHREIRILLD